MGKKTSTPAAPDYTALAEQQAQSQRTSQYNPWGSQVWSEDPNSMSGYRLDTTLNPMDQANLDMQRGLQGQMMGTASNMLGKYGSSGSSSSYGGGDAGQFKMGKLPDLADPSFGAVQEVQDAMMSRMVPDMERARQQQEARLVAQGIGGNTGGEAWDRMQAEVGRNENDQRQQALLGAMGAYNDIFNRSLANRNQMANEQLGAGQINQGLSIANMQDRTSNAQFNREADLKELMSMLAGGSNVQMPQFSQTGGIDYQGAGNQQYNAAMNAANAKNSASNNMWGTIGGLAGSIFSDIRLKDNIKRIGKLPNGAGVYNYDIDDRNENGVIAQELLHIQPSAIVTDPDTGYYKVDYSKLEGWNEEMRNEFL